MDWSVVTCTLDIDRKALNKAIGKGGAERLHLRFHLLAEQLPKVAATLARTPRPHLRALRISEVGFEPHDEVGPVHLDGEPLAALWAALPSLEELEIEGHGVVGRIDVPTLLSLTMVGHPLGDRDVGTAVHCPKLLTFRWHFTGDAHGVALEPRHIASTWTDAPSGLTTFDLCGSELDGSLLEDRSFLDSPMLHTLRVLGLPTVEVEELRALLPRLPVVERILVEDDDLAVLDSRIECTPQTTPVPPRSGAVSIANVSNAQLERLAERTGLRTADLTWHELTDAAGPILARLLNRNPDLQQLDLGDRMGGGLGVEGIAAWANGQRDHASLRTLRIRGNRLEGSGPALSTLLGHMPALEHLDIGLAYLNGADLEQVVPVLSRLRDLRTLVAGGQRRDAQSAAAMGTLEASRLESFDFYTMNYDDPLWAVAFADFARRLPRLQSLRLSGGRHGAVAIEVFARQLGDGLRFLELDLWRTDASFRPLAALFQRVPLEDLVIDTERTSHGTLTGSGLSVLSEATTLRRLALEGAIDVSVREVRAVVDGLGSLSKLAFIKGLKLKGDGVREALGEGLAELDVHRFDDIWADTADVLFTRGTLHELTIRGARFEDRLARLFEGSRGTSCLQTLRLRPTYELKSSHVKQLVDGLKGLPSVREVDLSGPCTVAVRLTLLKRLCKLGTLERLTLPPLHSLQEAATAWAADLGVELLPMAKVACW